MNRISKVITVNEITFNKLVYGVYSVIVNGRQEIFVKSGNSVGIIHFSIEGNADKCVLPACDDIKKNFLTILKREKEGRQDDEEFQLTSDDLQILSAMKDMINRGYDYLFPNDISERIKEHFNENYIEDRIGILKKQGYITKVNNTFKINNELDVWDE